ncbi:MAG: hypothetical protein Kow0081_3630 [Candidatus Dojkabacteria bacterium]
MKLLVQTALLFSTLTFGLIVISSVFLTIEHKKFLQENVDDVSVLLNAEKGEEADETLFLLAEDQDGEENANLTLCGAVHLGKGKALTAGHCVDKAEKVYFGKGTLDVDQPGSISFTEDFNVKRGWIGFDPVWTFAAVKNDLAIISFDESFLANRAKAEIGSFQKGCNYYVTAYGGEVGEDELIDIQDKRRQQVNEVCIEEFDEYVMLIKPKQNEGFCQGDSGSPVYEIGTNRVVGILSSTIGETVEDLCNINNRALAVRLDVNLDYIKDNIKDVEIFDEQSVIANAEVKSVDSLSDYISEINFEDWQNNQEETLFQNGDKIDTFLDTNNDEDTELGLLLTFAISAFNFILSLIGFIASFSLERKS